MYIHLFWTYASLLFVVFCKASYLFSLNISRPVYKHIRPHSTAMTSLLFGIGAHFAPTHGFKKLYASLSWNFVSNFFGNKFTLFDWNSFSFLFWKIFTICCGKLRHFWRGMLLNNCLGTCLVVWHSDKHFLGKDLHSFSGTDLHWINYFFRWPPLLRN